MSARNLCTFVRDGEIQDKGFAKCCLRAQILCTGCAGEIATPWPPQGQKPLSLSVNQFLRLSARIVNLLAANDRPKSDRRNEWDFMARRSHFRDMKRRDDPIAVLTAYDAPTAKTEEAAGVDIILVGDSVGTAMLGYMSEREVTLADMRHHVGAVRRGAPKTPIIADLPYHSYDTPESALNSSRLLIAAGADMVKFEGFLPDILAALVDASIEVCCHLGLEPQHHEGKGVKGRKAAEASRLVRDAIALDKAGMAMLVLELMPEEVAGRVTKSVAAPTIGIGAGRETDGQVLVITDVLGFTPTNYRHNRRYQEFGQIMLEAVSTYVFDVRSKKFPAEANMFFMDRDELEKFLKDNP
ncbi:MAG TPA: 3-methyl-2-oxobutanoate hydroxymethyltransferase [Methylocella sp.]|nr:3-methyl-2-oxobutanoate hydroxymethyltransferase [Methylocella sp.]